MKDVDRLLEEALRVDPSPDLAARVRQRLSEQPRARPWTLAWKLPAFAAALGTLAIAAALLRPRPVPPPPVRSASAPPRVAEVSIERSAPPASLVARQRGAATVGHQASHTAPARPRPAVVAELEVLVPPGEALALARFVDIMQTATVEPSGLAHPAAPDQPLADVPLVIEPLDVSPLSAEEPAPGSPAEHDRKSDF